MLSTSTVMTKDVVVVSPLVSVGGAAHLMARLIVRHLPVVQAGRLVGILSDRDLLKHDASVSCGEAMTPGPVTCPPNTPVGRAAEIMLHHRIDSVPIVGGEGVLVGLVTSTDLLRLLVEREGDRLLPFDFRLRVADTDGEALAVAA